MTDDNEPTKEDPTEAKAAETDEKEATEAPSSSPPDAKPEAEADASTEQQPSSSEERIRGGGKVTNDRGGRNSRRHQPYSDRNKSNNDDGGGGARNQGDRNCRVYVGNLSWNVSWQDLKDHMKASGFEVTRANIMTTPDGRSKGCGIVEFSTPEGAQKAVETLNDTELNGRNIFVREDREDKSGPGGGSSASNSRSGTQSHRFTPGVQSQGQRVYVGNLSWDVRWQDLKVRNQIR
jgi:RNA recognition motif-containing protein